MKLEGPLQEGSYAFSLRIIKMYHVLSEDRHEKVLAKQILRSGTSIGANVSESRFAASKPDFRSKLTIALKEANETDYWLNLLHDSGYLTNEEFASLDKDLTSLINMLVKSLKTTQKSE